MYRRLSIVLLAVAILLGSGHHAPANEALRGFVTRRGDELWEGDKSFRFISFNVPNLQIVEDNFAPDAATAWGWPVEFELADALESIRQMGGTVARSYVLSVRREGSDMGDHVYVRGPGLFNEEAFRTLDLAIELAGRKGVRLIIPLVDEWKWHGGRGEYAAFRGKEPDAFWTDEQIINDFEQTVRHVLTRVNTRTGVPYRDDPAILAWETGNELDCPPQWTARIARLIKSLDPDHLVVDGGSWRSIPPESLTDPNIDIVATHHYPNIKTGSYVPAILAAREASKGKKAYVVGEFGFAPLDEVQRVYDAVIQSGASGALFWSLRYHHRRGGFYWHSEPAGGGLHKAYHWPGFDSGALYQERPLMELTRRQAYAIRGLDVPPREKPAPPRLLPITDASAISWQGSAGALDYIVERATAPAGPWRQTGLPADDTAVQYRPLFNDAEAEVAQSYYYRVIARNEAGKSRASNVVGPVAVPERTLVDECRDLSLASETSGAKPTRGEDRKRREDAHRLALEPGDWAGYQVEGPIKSWQAEAYLLGENSTVRCEYSNDGRQYAPAKAAARHVVDKAGDYGYLPLVFLDSEEAPPKARYLRFIADGDGPGVELGRIVIHFDD